MPVWGAIAAGAAVAGALRGGSKGPSRRHVANAIADYRRQRPTGYITPEDQRAAELTRGRLSETATQSAHGARYEALRRYSARGLGGSPSQERTLGRIGDQEALGRQHAATAAEEQLYNVRLGREGREWERESQIFGASVNQAFNEQRRDDLQKSTFLNGLMEFIPVLSGYFSGGGITPTAANLGDIPLPGAEPSTPGYDPSVDTGAFTPRRTTGV